MLTTVEVRNPAGDLLSLPLDDISDGYVLQDVEGIDPVKATIVSSTFATLDGVQYQTARREARNLLITLGLEPDYASSSVRELRSNLYNWFMSKAAVNLRFYDSDGLVVEINGRVESLEAPLFVKEPKAVISVLCSNPDFVELDEVTGEGDTVSDTTEFLIVYNGTVETGIRFELNLDRSLTDFSIIHRPPDGIFRTLDFEASLLDLDVVTIDTNVGQKSFILSRSSVESSILYARQPGSAWFLLQPGDNYFRFYAAGDPIPFTYAFTERHGGL